MLRRDRKWLISEELMEKKLFVSVTENSEGVVVQETANNLCEEAAWTISNPTVRVKQLTSPSSALWL